MDERKHRPNKQTSEQRKLHHTTREDRQRKAYGTLLWRMAAAVNPRTQTPFNVEAARRDAESLRSKLNIQ